MLSRIEFPFSIFFKQTLNLYKISLVRTVNFILQYGKCSLHSLISLYAARNELSSLTADRKTKWDSFFNLTTVKLGFFLSFKNIEKMKYWWRVIQIINWSLQMHIYNYRNPGNRRMGTPCYLAPFSRKRSAICTITFFTAPMILPILLHHGVVCDKR